MKKSILVAKVYGQTGHRQRESFSHSYRYNFSCCGDGLRVLSVINSDKTATNDYSVIVIERENIELCKKEFDGQLTDGIFENSRIGMIEIATDKNEKARFLKIAREIPFSV